MNSFAKWIGAATIALAAVTAQARYVVADYAGKGKDPNKRTHIIVAGKGTDMGLQFHMAAGSQARKILDVNPNDQVILISVMEKEDGESDDSKQVISYLKRYGYTSITQMLTQWGFGSFENINEDLETQSLVNEIEKYNQVASLNIYAHSTTFYGLILDGIFNRVDPRAMEILGNLKNNFVPGAYAWFHGCNTGQKIIRQLSEKWGIPIAGAYTSTAFQELYMDSTPEAVNFYHSYTGNPPLMEKNGKMVPRRMGVNKISFAKTYTCDKVPCVRMFPDNHGYVGWWGTYKEGGLGFYKFSCSSKSIPNKDVCYAGMARGLINQVSEVYTNLKTDLNTYKHAVQDHLCPRGNYSVPTGYTYEKCASDLEASLTNQNVTVDPFFTKSLSCDLNNDCHSAWTCTSSGILDIIGVQLLQKSSCSLINKKDPRAPNRTMVDEYAKYMKGFALLQQGK